MSSSKPQRFFPATPDSRYLSTEENEFQVRAVTEKLLREFRTQQERLSSPVSSPEAKKLRSVFDALRNANRLKETRVRELRETLRQIVILNGGALEETSFVCSPRSSLSLKLPPRPEVRISALQREIALVEESISSESCEAERVQYLFENTNRALQASRTRCRALQRQSALVLGKFSEVQDMEAKSRYDLQHVRAEVQMLQETVRREAEKRAEKLDFLRKDKRDIEDTTAKLFKAIAEEMVRGQTFKDVAEKHALQIDAICDKHIRSLADSRLDRMSKEALEKALQTICELLNRSETLNLERPLASVSLSDLLGYSQKFEMKMSSLEYQVQTLSEWKAQLELSCVSAQSELQALRAQQFQSEELTVRIQDSMRRLGVRHACDTYNQLKTFLETISKPLPADECGRYEAFLASSFLTLNIVRKRLLVLLSYIQHQTGSHPQALSEQMQAFVASPKQEERLELNYGCTASPSGSERSELGDVPPPEQELSSVSAFFREVLEDSRHWTVDIDPLVREMTDILMIRIFAVDQRLKTDMRNWKSAQESAATLLEEVNRLAHGYLRDRMEEAFRLMRSLVACIFESSQSLESEVVRIPLSEAQLSVFLDFKLSQITGVSSKPMTVTEKSVHEIIRKAFEKKYRKLMAQQRSFRLEEESADFVSKFHKRRIDSLGEVCAMERTEASEMDEDSYAVSMRTHAKSAGNSALFLPKPTERSNASPKLDAGTTIETEIDAFAQVRSINEKIRTIKGTEKVPKSPNSVTLPEIKVFSPSSPKLSERKTFRSKH